MKRSVSVYCRKTKFAETMSTLNHKGKNSLLLDNATSTKTNQLVHRVDYFMSELEINSKQRNHITILNPRSIFL